MCLMKCLKQIRTKVDFSVGGEFFHCTRQHVKVKGFTSIMPWLAVNEKNLPQFVKGERIEVSKVDLYEGSTAAPPDYLSESELISLMEKYGIGTDASIPVHINNICERNYVQVQGGRKLVPTALGITLVRGYQGTDPPHYLLVPPLPRSSGSATSNNNISMTLASHK